MGAISAVLLNLRIKVATDLEGVCTGALPGPLETHPCLLGTASGTFLAHTTSMPSLKMML